MLFKLHYSKCWISLLLLPLSGFFYVLSNVRKFLYQFNFIKSFRLKVPVIVIGNITLGGTGKTPLVIYLANELKKRGYNPGILSRGYGSTKIGINEVLQDSDISEVGDEPLLIAKYTNAPVFIGNNRVLAATELIKKYKKIDVILCDDGMQHYRLKRDIEILVVDGTRNFGNGYLLPAGPLRETKVRLKYVDAVVCNDKKIISKSYLMKYKGDSLVNLMNGKKLNLKKDKLKNIHVVAGIGNPYRFFDYLKRFNIEFNRSIYQDHYQFTSKDFENIKNKNIIMTEKDAIKCTKFCKSNFWYLPIVAEVDKQLMNFILRKLKNINYG
ncbi:MAG: tetraacyldisaccharide 4'-kinase [Candidatus Methylopumilus sp.]|nr:tetraacyldisaccharide 4'-kinase [Candidatus Methylopumilus sp.]